MNNEAAFSEKPIFYNGTMTTIVSCLFVLCYFWPTTHMVDFSKNYTRIIVNKQRFLFLRIKCFTVSNEQIHVIKYIFLVNINYYGSCQINYEYLLTVIKYCNVKKIGYRKCVDTMNL